MNRWLSFLSQAPLSLAEDSTTICAELPGSPWRRSHVGEAIDEVKGRAPLLGTALSLTLRISIGLHANKYVFILCCCVT